MTDALSSQSDDTIKLALAAGADLVEALLWFQRNGPVEAYANARKARDRVLTIDHKIITNQNIRLALLDWQIDLESAMRRSCLKWDCERMRKAVEQFRSVAEPKQR